MPEKSYDVIVIGTGAGGGMAIKTLCEAGLTVCALNSGRRLDPAKDFRNHRQPYDMIYRGFGDPKKRDQYYHIQNEYSDGLWEHGITYTTAPGTNWEWPRCHAVGGKTNFWGRSAARMGDIDFKTASQDGGYDVDWPVSYRDIAPFYSRVERMIGVASTVQGRPSNPDGDYLPSMKLRCLDYILKGGCDKVGIPYLPDRLAQLTVPHQGRPACHYCGNCTEGCDTGSFFSTPWFLLPPAEKTGKLELRTNAVAKRILSADGRATGVLYVDRETKQEVEVHGKAVVLAASCVESARILLNSKSAQAPNGLANSSGQAGRNLCDHLYGTTGYGYLPQLLGQPSFPDNISSSQVVWMPRWQNLESPRKEKFVRGYSIYPTGGCGEFPGYHEQIEGFGSELKRELKRHYPAPIGFYCQIPSLPSPTNYVDIDPEVKDAYGIPVVRVHFQWGPNEILMWEHSKQATAEAIEASGGKLWGAGKEPYSPGWSLHETGTLRMGSDPKQFVTNAFGQTHDVSNLFVCDASVFLGCTDKTTTLSILAFSLRTSDHVVERFRKGGP